MDSGVHLPKNLLIFKQNELWQLKSHFYTLHLSSSRARSFVKANIASNYLFYYYDFVAAKSPNMAHQDNFFNSWRGQGQTTSIFKLVML